ncbi:MAG TPA: hypothetical protein VKV06_07680, partial [Acidimicrobiales bacterium]|nr:hypothetical protein [Acidimicrobiales bacterium]
DHRPYPDPPARLADLKGPAAGQIELPLSIYWGPKRSYDMATDADHRVVYETVLQEAAEALGAAADTAWLGRTGSLS